MSRVRKRILPVQDSGRPQDATLTGEGAQNLQDQMLKKRQHPAGEDVGGNIPPPFPKRDQKPRRLWRAAGGTPETPPTPNRVPRVLGAR